MALKGITKYHSLDYETHPLSCSCILVTSVVFLSYSPFVCSRFALVCKCCAQGTVVVEVEVL